MQAPDKHMFIGGCMRLDEIEQGTAAEQRVERMKDNAKTAEDKAKQLTTQANVSADQLKLQKSREQLAK